MTDDIDEIVRLKGHVANLQDIAGKQNAEIEQLKAERDKWYETFKAEMLDCAEWKARAEAAEKELRERRAILGDP